MAREAINPKSVHDSLRAGYSHAIRATGQATIYFAGQVGLDKDGTLVGGGDVVAQSRQALANLKTLLAESGATAADVVRLKIYVVDHKAEYLEPIGAEIAAFFGDAPPPANTWLGVQRLAIPELLIEIEATAVVDG